MKQSINCNDVLLAIDRLIGTFPSCIYGLCYAFDHELPVERILCKLGAAEVFSGAYYWPLSEEGRDQRLMMLAFMLTWLEDV